MSATSSHASRLVVMVVLVALTTVVAAEGLRHRRSNTIAFPGPEAFGVISGLRPVNSSGPTRPATAENSINRAPIPPPPPPPTQAQASSSNTVSGSSNGESSNGPKECLPYGSAASREDPSEAVEAMFHIGKRLEHLLRDPSSTNLLHSPMGLVASLGQLLLAAKGETLSQLEKLLGCTSTFHASMRSALSQITTPTRPNTYQLSVRNGLFHQPPPVGRVLNTNFTSRLANYYNTEIFAADFRSSPIYAQQQVNQWALKASQGKIDQLMPYIPPRTTTAILSSIVYFKAKWENQFNKRYTHKGTFYIDGDHRGHTKMVDFMSAEFELQYTESPLLGLKMVGLPYMGNDTFMFLVMPLGSSRWKSPRPQLTATRTSDNEATYRTGATADEIRRLRRERKDRRRRRQQRDSQCLQGDRCRRLPEDLPEGQSPFSGTKVHEIAGRLGARQFNSLVSAAMSSPPTRVSLFLPRLSMKSNVRLKEALAALGLNAIFGDAADFSGAVSGEGEGGKWAVDEVWQQSRLEVTEEGTEAASGTAALIVDYSLDAATFKANSPFIAIIQHMPTSAPLFWATIADPS
ncbi:uncharacterized protein LOC124166582 [Ischnura elegans]|uniref:uncharacterized protein LOC124166582 n=1 Tax=Ischnura elegans TaxID=197161 RepID=UPI001ED87070|nr:uncharacterized protein LOC124166582 [Ischnura elegans]